ncbi:hypothetical protein HaLaN_16081 [Haematococcus lacustris]|uniref:Uncharacterized protein n=1 Tax=Haematococcus lacustris TaxID=44745 RepID=A0A699ZBS2_HAELA|nr:hypothetical protein HaLaN_16081 [Haematococcus lacustris]
MEALVRDKGAAGAGDGVAMEGQGSQIWKAGQTALSLARCAVQGPGEVMEPVPCSLCPAPLQLTHVYC